MSTAAHIVPMPIGRDVECAQCKKKGVTDGVRPNFLLLPEGWVFALGRVKDRSLVIMCCSKDCGANWQTENVKHEGGSLQ